MSNPSVDTYADVSETIFDSSFNLIGNKDVLCDAAACANGTGFDSADFAPQTSLLVFANISAVSAGVGDVAEIDTITLRFAQIPEPGTLTLLALGMTGMGWSLRRRRVRGRLVAGSKQIAARTLKTRRAGGGGQSVLA